MNYKDIKVLKRGQSGFVYIYILKDPNTNEIRYVGKASDVVVRLKEHIRKSKLTKTHKNNWIQSLIKLDKLPMLEIVDIVPIDNWGEHEQNWIDFFKLTGANLTNIANGGRGGNLGEIVNKKISEAKKGFKHSIETKEKIKNYRLGKTHTIETLNLFSEQRKGCHNSRYGCKISESIKKYKKIIQLNLDDNILKIWDGITIASNELKINRSSITDVCYGRHKTAGGYKWKLLIN